MITHAIRPTTEKQIPLWVQMTIKSQRALAGFFRYLADLTAGGFVESVSMEPPLDNAKTGHRICIRFTTTMIPPMPDDIADDVDTEDTGEFSLNGDAVPTSEIDD